MLIAISLISALLLVITRKKMGNLEDKDLEGCYLDKDKKRKDIDNKKY